MRNRYTNLDWLVTIIIALIPVLIWLFTQPTQWGNAKLIFENLGKLAGLSGLALFCWSVILSARLKIFGRWFMGLDNMYRAHHLISCFALILLLIHPMLLTTRYLLSSPISAYEFIKPSPASPFRILGSLTLFSFIALMILTLYVNMRQERMVLVMRLLGLLVFFGGLHAILVGGSDINSLIWLQIYVLGLLATAGVVYVYRSLFHGNFAKFYDYSVTSIEHKNDIIELYLDPKEKPITFLPGQFAFVKLESDGVLGQSHPFSISSAPSQTQMRFSIKQLGDYTSALSQAKVGQFVGATVSGSSNLMGQFGSFGGNLTVTDSSNILGGADGGSSITNSSNAIVGLQGNSTINFGLNSLIRINAGSATNVDTSIIQANNGTLLNLSRVTANGSNINLSGVSDSAFIGSDINITNTTRSAITGVSVTASDTTNTNATGFVLGLDNVDWSNINGFSTNITDSSWSNIMANGPIGGIATIQNLSHFTGGFQGSVSINGIYGGAGNIVESDVDSSGALYGGIHLADVNNTNELVGTHGGYCNNDVPLGPFGCDAGYNIRFDIHDSGGLVGNSRWTNIYSSNRDLLNVDTSDPLAVTPSSLTNVDYSMVIGQDLTLSGLNHSLFIGNSATISDVGIGPYDYSFIGSDSVGNINTRINNKGNDSWVNISGGKFGIGTNAPANKLDVTDTSDDTPASFTGTSGTCTVDTNAGSLSCVSDAKLKTNILSISNGLDVINQLQGVTYNWKVNPEGNKVAGFIAQDVAKVLPNLVTTLPDGTLTLNKEGVMPYIVQAVKEQNGNLDKTNQQLSDQGIKLTSLSDDLLALAKRVDENTQQLKDQQNQIDKLTQMVQQQAKDIEQLKNTSPVTP